MLVMQLVEEQKLSLDAKLASVLPYYRKDTGGKVTIHHLLTHTSGIPSYTSLPNFERDISRNPYGVREFIEKYCSGDLEFEPGTKFLYDSSGYFILGAIVEQVAGKPYEQLLRERIFDPLGIEGTGLRPESAHSRETGTRLRAGTGWREERRLPGHATAIRRRIVVLHR